MLNNFIFQLKFTTMQFTTPIIESARIKKKKKKILVVFRAYYRPLKLTFLSFQWTSCQGNVPLGKQRQP